MIDLFTIFHKGGAILWSKQLVDPPGNPVDEFVKTVLLEEKYGQSSFNYKNYILKWTLHNELNLVFVAVYLNLSRMLYIDAFLEEIRETFTKLYSEKIISQQFDYDFNEIYEEILKRYEKEALRFDDKKPRPFSQTKKSQQIKKEMNSEEKQEVGPNNGNINPDLLPGNQSRMGIQPKGRKIVSKKEKKNVNTTNENTSKKAKQNRRWDNSFSKDEEQALDYSKDKETNNLENIINVNDNTVIIPTQKWSDDEEENEKEEPIDEPIPSSSSRSSLFSYFSDSLKSLTGNKELTNEKLQPILNQFKEILLTKNVAEDIASKLCQSVLVKLVGQKPGTNFLTLYRLVRNTFEKTLSYILTPKSPIDLYNIITNCQQQGRICSIAFLGVNGVGKSTSLSKIAYYLKSRQIKVCIAACDTFRSGAVEQLRVHAQRLDIPIYYRQYGSDASGVCTYCIKQAIKDQMDVILIDTAGRMQDNEPLMRAISKLVHVNQPDLVLFVGEALVGNDGIDQLHKFNCSLSEMSPVNSTPRFIDGIILTKYDTVDDKVGAAISMTYLSGQPILFVGTGQNYSDLKRMNVKTLIHQLLY